MQLLRDNRDLFIIAPSFILIPIFPELAALSEPARSINDNLLMYSFDV
jgi:hypothetical protein